VNQLSNHIEKTTAAAAGGDSFNTVAVLEQLLIQTIHLRDLHTSARWQISRSEFSEIRDVLKDHHKQQLNLIGLLVDRIRILGSTDRVFAGDFLQRAPCRVIRGPREINQLLLDLLEAHEAVLSAAHAQDPDGDPQWVHELAVGQVVLTNEQQWETINGRLMRARPQQRLLETDTSRLHGCE